MSQHAINDSNQANQDAKMRSEQLLQANSETLKPKNNALEMAEHSDDLWTPSQKRAMRLVSQVMVKSATRMSRMDAQNTISETVNDGVKKQKNSFKSLFKRLVKG
ncbi:MAG: hypothetical protein O3A01_07880 [bacterium]|nr:hypothetical protein [bacterium]